MLRTATQLCIATFLLVVMLQGGCLSLTITQSADGCLRILSCRGTRENDTVNWFRNDVKMIEISTSMVGFYNNVSYVRGIQNSTALVSMSVSTTQHNVTINLNLPYSEVWRCETELQTSNNLTLTFNFSTPGKPDHIQYDLTSTPWRAGEDQTVTLTCRNRHSSNTVTVLWYRNCAYVFQTSSSNYATKTEDRSVSGRISVDATVIRHNVILTINSTLDEGSVWTCGLGRDFSNGLILEMSHHVPGISSLFPTDRQTTGTVLGHTTTVQESGMKANVIYVITGSAAGGAVLVLIVTTTACLQMRRASTKRKRTDVRDKNAHIHTISETKIICEMEDNPCYETHVIER